jgi:hypothetical protein
LAVRYFGGKNKDFYYSRGQLSRTLYWAVRYIGCTLLWEPTVFRLFEVFSYHVGRVFFELIFEISSLSAFLMNTFILLDGKFIQKKLHAFG